jgi:hypothetical protein
VAIETKAMTIDLTISPSEFFRQQILEAVADRDAPPIDQDVEHYLVELMCKFISLEGVGGQHLNDPMGTPLVMMLQEAIEAPREKRLQCLKTIGDTSLYVSGFFQDYFNRKAFTIDYYKAIGAGAYNGVANMAIGSTRNHSQALFSTLASSFGSLVDIIAMVSDRLTPAGHVNLLAIYERWTTTQSDRLRRKLIQSGILPIEVDLSQAQ